jgi:hypothetical protein
VVVGVGDGVVVGVGFGVGVGVRVGVRIRVGGGVRVSVRGRERGPGLSTGAGCFWLGVGIWMFLVWRGDLDRRLV